jgi:hypothetical protein
MDSMSKFKDLFQEAKRTEQSPAKEQPAKRAVKKTTTKAASVKARPTGRRSDPSYIGVFAYIPKAVNEDVKEKLFKRKDLDFSSLVEDLLSQWLSKQR